MMLRFIAFFMLFSLTCCASPSPRSARFPTGQTVQLFYDVSDLPSARSDIGSNDDQVRAGPRLNADQRRRLEASISFRPVDPNESFAACFVPHHFFKYFDGNGNETGSVSVCFCCAGARLSSDSAGMNETESVDMNAIEAIVTELGVSTDLGC